MCVRSVRNMLVASVFNIFFCVFTIFLILKSKEADSESGNR